MKKLLSFSDTSFDIQPTAGIMVRVRIAAPERVAQEWYVFHHAWLLDEKKYETELLSLYKWEFIYKKNVRKNLCGHYLKRFWI